MTTSAENDTYWFEIGDGRDTVDDYGNRTGTIAFRDEVTALSA